MEHRDLNDLAAFSAIAQEGSITGAAKKLQLPKSNLSRRLARLEERLGVSLIERNTRSSRMARMIVKDCVPAKNKLRYAGRIESRSTRP